MKKDKPFRELCFPSLKKTLLIMRNAAFLLILGILQAHAVDAYSQKTRLSLDFTDTELIKVLDNIEVESEFFFLYNEKLLDTDRKVDITANNQLITNILDNLFAGTDVKYSIIDRKIILAPDYLTKETDEATLMQQQIVTGTVTDESTGDPMPGVNIVVKGTNIGTITDIAGNYSLSVADRNATLVYSFIGYINQEIPLNGRTALSVVLSGEIKGLDEVVVVGYGTMKKVNLTGSVSTVKTEQLESRPIVRVSSALQGQMAGVTVISPTGSPGASSTILIRGIGTMNNSNPMILVDGIETSMENINPADIDRVDVLKDAASAAIYGTRAANGVILITTKRGAAGKVKVKYSSYLAKQVPTALPEYLSSYEYAKLYNIGLANEGKEPLYSESDIEKFRNGSDPFLFPNTDWLDLILKGSGLQQTHLASLSGGTEQSKYLLSFGYVDQDGLVENNYYNRYNLRFNLDSKVTERLSFALSSHLVRERSVEPMARYNEGVARIFQETHRIPPTYAVKDANGNWVEFLGNNPIAWIENFGGGKRQVDNNRAIAILTSELEIVQGLMLKGSVSADYFFGDNNMHVKEVTYAGGIVQGPNYIRNTLNRSYNIVLQSFLDYEKSFGNHQLKGLLGIARESYRYDSDEAYREKFPSNLLTEISAGSTDGQTSTGSGNDSRLGSYFGRINYGYKEKYLLEFNLRRDGSSKFASDKRWGWFPSVSAGWRLSEESFMETISFINDLKLRGSYGVLGNHRTSEYLFMPKLSLGQRYLLDGTVVNGAAVTSAPSPDLTWEVSTEYNIGIDVSLFDNKLNFSTEYYNRYTDDILTTVPVTAAFGLSSPVTNIGAMRNKGFEFLLNYNNEIGKFAYNASFNLGLNKNIVEKWPSPSLGTQIRRVGDSWLAYYAYEWIGYFQTDEEAANLPRPSGKTPIKGDLKYKDQNNDSKIDANDRVVLGNSVPGQTYGINLNASYINFDLGLFFQGAGDFVGMLDHEAIWPFFNGGKVSKTHLNYWSPENPDAEFPILRIDQAINDNQESSFNIRDASYLRLKNLQIGYTLPEIKKLSVSSVKIYLSGENLWTITNYFDDFDPETPNNARRNYPQVKTYTIGIDVNF